MLFLWDRDHKGDCSVYTHSGGKVSKPETRPLLEKGCDIFIRYNEAVNILHKVWVIENNTITMDNLVSSQKPFGLGTRFQGTDKPKSKNSILVYGNTGKSYIERKDITKQPELIDCYKVFIPAAGSGSDVFPHSILGRPFLGDKGTACSETYVVLGPLNSEIECQNLITYITTKFFRFLVMLKKPTQHALKKVYSLVPMQDFSKPWVDEELYIKYNLTGEEIGFIENKIRAM